MTHGLTLAWLGLWTAAQVLCHVSRRSFSWQPRAQWRIALLVSCLTVLLFPVISNDDDAAWARQLQTDFESTGVTQATRAFSRYDLAAALLTSCSSTQADFFRSERDRIYGAIVARDTTAPVAPFLLSVPLLRAPPLAG